MKRILCFIGYHDWRLVSWCGLFNTLDECHRCGKGRAFIFAGYASDVQIVSRRDMDRWRQSPTGLARQP